MEDENYELVNLKLGEVSFVPSGDDPLAKVAFTKRKENPMEDNTIKMSDKMKERMKYYIEEKGMSEDDARKACMREMEKAWDFQAENERLRKFLIENDYVIKAEAIEKKVPMETIEINGEAINKADIPAPVLKALEEAEVAKRDVELTKAAQEKLPNWDEAVAKELMKFDLDDKIMEALMAADAAFEAVMTEKGQDSAADDLSNPEDKLNELAKSKKAEYGTFEKAYAAVVKTDEGKALLKAMKEDK